jgi:amidase
MIAHERRLYAARAMPDAQLAYAGLSRQAELVRNGEVSSRELVELYLERIERHDPRLNAFHAVLAEQALAEADQADGRRGAREELPLLGVPIAIKDDMDVAGVVTSRGTSAHGGPAAADAEVVRRLRAGGAVILGKTHVPELEILPVTDSPTCGITRNPWDLDRTPGGSSGGSAAAVAAGLVGAAIGSDGAGSIRIPAGCCGLVGLKPQRGRVSSAPQLDHWQGLTSWGVLARRVEDVALFHDVVNDYGPSFVGAASDEPAALRIAVAINAPPGVIARPDDEQRQAVALAVEHLRSLGHTTFDTKLDYGALGPNLLARYWRGIHDDARAMAHPERLSRRTRGYARLGAAVTAAGARRARAREAGDRQRLCRIFERADLVLTPQFTRRPVPVMEWEGLGAVRTYLGTSAFVPYNGAFNHTGQPAMAVPVGATADGFPLAVQLAAPPDGEPTLLALAAQLQRVVGWPDRRPPGFE